MKNSGLNILKLILGCILAFGLLMSCEKPEPERSTTKPSLPHAGQEVLVKLLIKGEAIIPPSTRAMDTGVEGSYQDSLQLLILEEKEGVYKYHSHRPVEGTPGNFSVRVPISLDKQKLKFLLFSNSKTIIGNPDTKFTAGTTTESDIRSSLTLQAGAQWKANRKIPMWAEDAFTFTVPATGSSAAAVANLKLMRMLARVDVGIKYNGNDLTSTAAGLANFKLKQIRVHHSKDKGQLMPGTDAYSTATTAGNKVITVTKPSIPTGGNNIPPYGISITNDAIHACEREIYMFEQQITGKEGFDVNRTCILVQGEYTAGTVTKTGWYRLDFRGFKKTAADAAGGYADILRNMLYRFNITAVKGPGFATEEDALSSVSSNITVELIPLELNQNDIIFDGQSYLSVNKSELYFYRNKNKASFSLSTDYAKGWEIQTTSDVTASPGSGTKGSAVAELTWNPLPTTASEKEIHLTAGNLKKTIVLKYLHRDAPGDLQNFSLDPSVLYFIQEGAVGTVNVVSNITEKYLFKTEGKLSFTIPEQTSAESFNVTVAKFSGTSSAEVESGAVEVNVKAANADITGQCNIRQLTYTKDVSCTPGVMPHGLGGKVATLDVEYSTKENPGTYWINFLPTANGHPSDSRPSGPNSDLGNRWAVRVTAQPNKTSERQKVGELQFEAALNGEEIPLLGYTPEVVEIFQEPAPPPVITHIETPATTLPWNHSAHSFTVKVENHDLLADGPKTVTITTPGSRKIDMTMPDKGLVDEPVNFTMQPNRGDRDKTKTVEVSVKGHGDHKATDRVTYTQEAPEAPVNAPSMGYFIDVEANAREFKLDINNLSHIYETRVIDFEEVSGSGKLIVNSPYPEVFSFTNTGKTEAEAIFSINPNTSYSPLKTRIVVKAIGNRQSQFFTRHFTVTQKAAGRPGTITVTPASFTKGPEAGDYNNEITVAHTNIPAITVSANTSWIKPTYSNNRVSFRLEKNNTYVNRTGTITVGGTDESGERREATVSITQTAYPRGTITIPSLPIMSMWGNAPSGDGDLTNKPDFEGTFQYTNIPDDAHFDINREGDWITDIRIDKNNGRFFYRLESNSGNPQRTGKIIISSTDRAGNRIESEVAIDQREGTSLTIPKKGTLYREMQFQVTIVRAGNGGMMKASITDHNQQVKLHSKSHPGGQFLDSSPKEIGTIRNLQDGMIRITHTMGDIIPSSFVLAIWFTDSDGRECYKSMIINEGR